MSQELTINVRFHAPPVSLQRYFTTFYLTEIDLPPGQVVTDALQPEWANLRFFSGAAPKAWIKDGDRLEGKHFVATGPSIKPTNFVLGANRMWGIGLLPLGWARFIGLDAADHANLLCDGYAHPAFRKFGPLAQRLIDAEPVVEAELAAISAFFLALPELEPDEEARILAIHNGLVDPEIDTVAQLVDKVGAGQRTIERLCTRHFGFAPKLLLRRQRFMRSLAQYMLDPSRKWIGSMDEQYHDQAQFVRDFREFMGMSPSQYAALPHPVLEKFMHERARVHGAAAQTLDVPGGAGAAKA